jgi:hypothetical protein
MRNLVSNLATTENREMSSDENGSFDTAQARIL